MLDFKNIVYYNGLEWNKQERFCCEVQKKQVFSPNYDPHFAFYYGYFVFMSKEQSIREVDRRELRKI